MGLKTTASKTLIFIVDQKQGLNIWQNCITELQDRADLSEKLEVAPDEEVDAHDKDPNVLKSGVEKVIKQIRCTNATGQDDVSGDVLKLLGDVLKLLTHI